jgi:acetyl-CoA C-acetyltransferase
VPVDPAAPCLIGVARHTWRQEPAPEPLAMWETVARSAADDAGCGDALASVQSLQVVYTQSWEYDDPCARLAERLGARPAQAAYSGLGGSVPVRLVSEAASAMARGELDLALIVGGEALATRRHLSEPVWSYPPDEPRPFPITLVREEAANRVYQAYLTFALLDTARRAHLGRTPADHRIELGRLLAPLTEVAAAQPEHAWFPIARSAEEIATATPANRMVSTPYTKLMTAIMDVDMAAAVLVATEAKADALGVRADHRVYLRGAGSAAEPPAMASRPELWRSPAMERAMRGALGTVSVDDVDHFDLYSCFASSLGFACDALSIAPDRGLTVTGGLPYHGGPGSNYTTHALAAMVEALRSDPGSFGLVSGVGMHMASHAAALLSTQPGPFAPDEGPGPDTAAAPTVPLADGATGPARIAAYSTVYSREGPEWTALICDLPDGSRSYARMQQAAPDDDDLSGQTVTLSPGKRGSTTAQR